MGSVAAFERGLKTKVTTVKGGTDHKTNCVCTNTDLRNFIIKCIPSDGT